MNKRIRKTHPREFKLEAVRQVKDSNKTIAQIASEFGLNENVLRRWYRELKIRDDIIDHIHDAIIVTDINSIIVTWNHGAEIQLGYKAIEDIGLIGCSFRNQTSKMRIINVQFRLFAAINCLIFLLFLTTFS